MQGNTFVFDESSLATLAPAVLLVEEDRQGHQQAQGAGGGHTDAEDYPLVPRTDVFLHSRLLK